ncbi:MAG: hypothetical protein V8T36_06175 [Ruthenibacterium lactatiformans]
MYEVSPTFAKLQDVLETPEMYNGYGDPETGELNSGGIHWALRKAAWTAGYYDTAQDAENFWRAVADEINAACDAGLVPAGRRHSGVFSPIKAEYVAPTIGKFFDEVKVFVLFEQTEPTQILSIARPDQTEEWESYLALPEHHRRTGQHRSALLCASQSNCLQAAESCNLGAAHPALAHAAAHRAVACAVCARLRTRTESSRLRTLRAAC